MTFKFNRADVFSNDGWIPVNKRLAHEVGLEGSVIYGELTRKEKWYKENDKLQEGGWFYVTEKDLEESTAIKRKGQDRGINALVKIGLIEKKLMGLPARRHFRLIDDGLEFESDNKNVQNGQTDNNEGSEPEKSSKPHDGQLVQNGQTGLNDSDKLDCPNWTPNNNKYNNNNLNNNNLNNLSIKEADITKLDVPIPIQKQLILNIDRLIDDNILLNDIEISYKANKDIINEYQFAQILNNVLHSTQDKIRNIQALLNTSISNYRKGNSSANHAEYDYSDYNFNRNNILNDVEVDLTGADLPDTFNLFQEEMFQGKL